MRRLVQIAAQIAAPFALALACVAVACSSSNSGSSKPPPGTLARHDPPDQDGGANFATPPPVDEEPPAEPAPKVPPELAERIKRTFGDNCRYERSCGEMIGIDCDAAVDGPYYYVHRSTLEVVSVCGGACMRGCTNCPPSTWTCATY